MFRGYLLDRCIQLKAWVKIIQLQKVNAADEKKYKLNPQFEISCSLNRLGKSAESVECKVLCEWKVKRTLQELHSCLKVMQGVSFGEKEKWKLIANEIKTFTFAAPTKKNQFIPGIVSSNFEISKIERFIEILHISQRKIPFKVQEFLVNDMYDYKSLDPLFLGLDSSSYRHANSILWFFSLSILLALLFVAFNNLIFLLRLWSYVGFFEAAVIIAESFVFYIFSLFNFARVSMKTAIFLAAILIGSHRVLGVIGGWYIRVLMGNTAENGKFDIHIGWIGLRLGLDKNQIVISGLVWKNAPRFKSTPCFISIKEITLTISTKFIYRVLCARKLRGAIQIDELTVDRLHVYIEKTDRKEDGINLWAALGAENAEQEKKVSGGIMDLLASAGGMTVGALSSTANAGINAATATADVGMKAASATAKVGLSAVTATASVGLAAVSVTTDAGMMALSTTKDIGSSIGTSISSGANTLFSFARRPSTNAPSTPTSTPSTAAPTTPADLRGAMKKNDRVVFDDKLAAESQAAKREIQDEAEEEEDDQNDLGPWRDVDDSFAAPAHESVTAPEKEKEQVLLEINRVLLMDLNVHAQDFLNAQHTESDDAPSIVVKIMSLFREHLTAPPKEKGSVFSMSQLNLMGGAASEKGASDGRCGIPPPQAVGRIINALVAELFATNKITMLRIISMATASQTLSLVTDAASFTMNGMVGAVQGVGSVMTSVVSPKANAN